MRPHVAQNIERRARAENFPFRTRDKLRYGDTDRQGHVNNAVFATFLETGRVDMLIGGGGIDGPDRRLCPARLALHSAAK